MKQSLVKYAWCLPFVATVWLANWMTDRVGFITVFGWSFTAGTLAAGLGFGLRDACHEVAGRKAVIAAIISGAIASWWVSPSLAVASGAAFLVSESADLAAYEPLRRRQWGLAVVVSNLLGGLVDTVVFLHLAGFPVSDAVVGQMVGKAAMVLPVLPLVWWARRQT